MGCIQSWQKTWRRKNGEVYNYKNNGCGESWLNRPQEGYHWEQNSQRNYERHLNDGTGCEYVIGGMAGVGMTGLAMANVMDAGCDGGDGGAACGAGGCGGCGAC